MKPLAIHAKKCLEALSAGIICLIMLSHGEANEISIKRVPESEHLAGYVYEFGQIVASLGGLSNKSPVITLLQKYKNVSGDFY